ncbi:DUF1315 family protein [Thalassotalea euphylliae]|uniref:DUF1315 family protein n=1 Tax=Thalassotalea euphylliae TaxID=1655234 RepID=A0A3E0TQV1_9GAMM|nr:DUF1315 family protein [Thalassotalea euphylliae]REL27021.1 DUF1315 family protein [Thalassotalea euphylliae]
MDIIQVVDNLSEEMFERFKSAAETGKWPEGTEVEQAQRDTAMQIVMAYQARRLKSKEMLTVGEDGEIVNKSKRELKAELSARAEQTDIEHDNQNNIARFTDL